MRKSLKSLKGMKLKDVNMENPRVQKVTREFKEFALGIFVAVLLFGIMYTILAPVIGIFSLSFMSMYDIFNPMVFIIPSEPSLYNIRAAVRFMDYWRVLGYTLGYSLGMALLHVLVASFVGYGFARFRFWGRGIIFGLIIFTIIIPAQAYMVPLFFTFRFFGPMEISLLDSYWPIIILTTFGVGLRSGLFIYVFRQFFRGLPTEINEAAYIDGAGPFRTYATVMMPNAKPAIITVLLLSLVWHYGDTFYSGMLMSTSRFIHVAAANVFGAYQSAMGIHSGDPTIMHAQMVAYAGVVLVILPMLVIYAFLQRQFIEGIERSGIVG